MKILQVIHSVDPRGGGPIEGIKQLVPALAREGVATEVMSLDTPGSAPTDFPVPLYALGPSRAGYGYTPRALPWLKENHANYDAVIVNGLWQYSSLVVWRALYDTKTPYFVYPHGMLDPWFKRHYPLKHLKKCLYWPWAEYQVLRDAKTVLFTSEEERRLARESFRPYRCNEVVTGYGINPPADDLSRQKKLFLETFPALQGKRLILFLGRMHEKKGCDLLLRAWKEISLSEAVSMFHLVMAGPVDDTYGQEMKALAKSLALKQSVSWPGMLSGDLKWGSLAAADAFVLPSHQENFGISVVEALACGVPVLISNKINIWRDIAEDDAGMVDEDDLAGTIRLLKKWITIEPVLAEHIRSRTKFSFVNRFNMNNVAQKIVVLLI